MATANRNPRETERVLQLYEKEAHKYDRQMNFFDRLLFAGGREWVCGQAEGEVLEIGVGNGRNLPHYRNDVRLTGVELSPAMLEIARARARELGREVDLRVGDAQALEFREDSFDTVVCTLSLCTIPDDRAAVAEVRRVLRPRRPLSPARARPQPGPADPLRPAAAGTARRPLRSRPPAPRAARAPAGRGLRGRAARTFEARHRRAGYGAEAERGRATARRRISRMIRQACTGCGCDQCPCPDCSSKK